MRLKRIIGTAERWELWSWRKATERGVHREWHKENTFPKPLVQKPRGVDFHEFLPSVELKDCYLRASGLGWDRDLRVVPYSWRKGRQVTLGEMA